MLVFVLHAAHSHHIYGSNSSVIRIKHSQHVVCSQLALFFRIFLTFYHFLTFAFPLVVRTIFSEFLLNEKIISTLTSVKKMACVFTFGCMKRLSHASKYSNNKDHNHSTNSMLDWRSWYRQTCYMSKSTKFCRIELNINHKRVIHRLWHSCDHFFLLYQTKCKSSNGASLLTSTICIHITAMNFLNFLCLMISRTCFTNSFRQ